jgi:endonuclease YncB( thermonuclease family)
VSARNLSLIKTIAIAHHNVGNGFMVKWIPLVILILFSQTRVGEASDLHLPLVRFQACYYGDTCTTTDAEKVRLACIDAPEITKPSRLRATRMSPTAYDNILFDRSANNLRALVSGRMVGIRRITRDRYGRTVAELFINNKNVGQQQVMSGHAVISQEHAWQCAWTSGL